MIEQGWWRGIAVVVVWVVEQRQLPWQQVYRCLVVVVQLGIE